MRTAIVDKKRRCPKRGKAEHQIHVGFNASGTQRRKCKDYNIRYIVEPRQHEHPEETNETRENVYILSMVSRELRQIAGHAVTQEKTSKYIQKVVDNAPEAKRYCTDGHSGYLDVVFTGEHIRNIQNKSDTFIVEGVNVDLRHYIPVLARRSRCFCGSLEILQAVVDVFVEAYNRFGLAKRNFKLSNQTGEFPLGLINFL